MKANQKFANADEAVSPVIGVILMVAITVVLAAVVFVLVNNLTGEQDANEAAAARVSSPVAGQIHITMITAGENAPYAFGEIDEFTIALNGINCLVDNAAGDLDYNVIGNGDAFWDAGETIIIANACTNTALGGGAALGEDTDHTVTITLQETVIEDSTPITTKRS